MTPRLTAISYSLAVLLLGAGCDIEVATNLTDVSIPGWSFPRTKTHVNTPDVTAEWLAAVAPARAALPTSDLYLVEAFLGKSCEGPALVSTNTMDTALTIKGLSHGQEVVFGVRVRNQNGAPGPTVCSPPILAKLTKPKSVVVTAPSSVSKTGELVFEGLCEDDTYSPLDLKIAICVKSDGTCDTPVDYTREGVCREDGSYKETVVLEDGIYDVKVAVKDPAGNFSDSAGTTSTVVVDTKGPLKPQLAALPSSIPADAASLAFEWTTKDVGPAGMRATDTYQIEVFATGDCAAPALTTLLTSNATQEIAGPFTVGSAVSIRVTAYDAFDHASEPACSPAVQIDGPTLAPPSLHFTGAASFVRASAITPLIPVNEGGAVSSCDVDPPLPAGLSLGTTDCVIHGTPTTASPATSYLVTGTNASGSSATTVSIEVLSITPQLSFAGPYAPVRNGAITPIAPTNAGDPATSCQVTPALPPGLTVDPPSCAVSGTPTTAAVSATYTVTATNTGGSVTATFDLAVLPIAPSISYGGPYTYAKGAAITSLSPTNAGDAATSCTVTPALPAGLTLAANCALTGTPTATTASATYTVTATNAGGDDSATVAIEVNDIAPAISFTGSITGTRSSAITTKTPSSTGGGIVSCAVTPALPSGLSLAATTCAISGTPTVISASDTYTVTATNTGGDHSATVSITVNDITPSISFTGSIVATRNSAITTKTPSNTGGTIVSCTVSPTLPSGLSFDTTTCAVSGTPTVASTIATFTITATNTGGNHAASLDITVQPIRPALTFTAVPTLTRFTAMTSHSPTNSGDTTTSCSSDTAMPAGLTLANDCTISGTPTAAGSYTRVITGSNAGGTDLAPDTVTITVNEAMPSLSYADTVATYNQALTLSPTVASNSGTLTNCTVSPALPTGLSIATTTCVISGTPTVPTLPTTYTVRAYTSAGDNTRTVQIEVRNFCGGLGTAVAPYKLCTPQDVYAIDTDGELALYYIVQNDIDFAGFNVARRYVIGSAAGHFSKQLDGNGKTIRNVTIDFGASGTGGCGFFRSVQGGSANNKTVIKNLKLEDVTVNCSAGTEVGGLASRAQWVDFISVEVTQSAPGGTVVTGYDEVGGLVGETIAVDLRSVGAAGAVSGNQYVGGIVGHNSAGTTTMVNSTSSASATGTGDNVGGLFGYVTSASVQNSTASGNVAAANNAGGGIGNAVNTTIASCSATGNATATTANAGGFLGTANNVQLSDVYATGNASAASVAGGMIGFITSATSSITNSWASGNTTTTGDKSGGLVGHLRDASVSLSYAQGAVAGNSLVGGLIGVVETGVGSLSQSYATGTVTATGNEVGGLVGEIQVATWAVSRSRAAGNVSGADHIGGLIGCTKSNVTNSYATGNVTATGPAGGLIGCSKANLTIANSYSSGSITTPSSDIGGLAGLQHTGTLTVTNSYRAVNSGTSYGTYLGPAQLTDQSSFSGWDFATPVWLIRAGEPPYLSFPEVVNQYYYVKDAVVSAGEDTLNLSSTAGLTAGNEILVIQMQHPTQAEAGIYELATVASVVDADTIRLTAGLDRTFESGNAATSQAKVTQVVKLHALATHTIKFGEVITARRWNGSTGGIVAIRATGTLTVAGKIDVKGSGFAGGTSAPVYPCAVMPAANGYAGESWSGRGSIGAAANGGGGGAGNSGVCSFNGWTGAAGGAGGGYGAAGENRNAWNLSPQVIQGSPGATYGNASLSRILLGSGGGAGGAHDVGASAIGGAGGGIVVILASQVVVDQSTGTIDASGANGVTAVAPSGAGGGGSGGSIYVLTTNGANTGTGRLSVTGGAGGASTHDATNTPRENFNYRAGGAGGAGRTAVDPP